MSKVLEVVRFTVKPALESQFLADRPAFVAAVRKHFPGLISVKLARVADHQYMDVAEWDSMELATRCAEQCMNVPEIASFFGPIDQVVSMEHAQVV